MNISLFAPQHASKLHLSSEIHLLKVDRVVKLPQIPMKSHCVKHRDLTSLAVLVDFEELYLGAQMEFGGVL